MQNLEQDCVIDKLDLEQGRMSVALPEVSGYQTVCYGNWMNMVNLADLHLFTSRNVLIHRFVELQHGNFPGRYFESPAGN